MFSGLQQSCILGSLGRSLFPSIFHEAWSYVFCEFPSFCSFLTVPPGQVSPVLSLFSMHRWKWKVPLTECSAEDESNKLVFFQLLCPKLSKKHKHCEQRNTRIALSHQGLITFFSITASYFQKKFCTVLLQWLLFVRHLKMGLSFIYPCTGLYLHSFGLFTIMQNGVSSFHLIDGFSCNHFPSTISCFCRIPRG